MIPKFFLSLAVVSILKSDKTAEAVKENAEKIDVMIDKEFGRKSENVQKEIVERILLPLAKELLKEDVGAFIGLTEEFARQARLEIADQF